MVREFKVGHWYRWVSRKERPRYFAAAGLMDPVLDGKPHLCVKAAGVSPTGAHYADFDCATLPKDFVISMQPCWAWHLDDFEEVTVRGLYAASGEIATSRASIRRKILGLEV